VEAHECETARLDSGPTSVDEESEADQAEEHDEHEAIDRPVASRNAGGDRAQRCQLGGGTGCRG
jgi:hypothetical protein